jgi:hypothetical protein
MEKSLRRLQYECRRSAKQMEFFLPHETLAYIGRSMTLAAIGEALSENVYPKNFDIQLERMGIEGTPITLETLEERTLPKREALGLKHGHRVLTHFVDQIYAPLEKRIELDRLHKGGRKPQLARKHFIRELARSAPDIIGKRATVSTTGRFADLCFAVLPACGLSSEGVEKAIPGIVTQIRIDQGKRANVNGGAK